MGAPPTKQGHVSKAFARVRQRLERRQRRVELDRLIADLPPVRVPAKPRKEK